MAGLRLSVALCTYNGERYLPEQLASFLAQERRPDEVVVGDDGSNDRTLGILREFAKSAPFAVRIQSSAQRLGVVKNFEQTIARCQGEVLFLSDQDDVWEPQKLRRIEEVFEQSPEVGLVSSNARIVDENLEPMGYLLWEGLDFGKQYVDAVNGPRAFEALLRHCPLSGHTMAFAARLREWIVPIPAGGWLHDPWIARMAAAVSRVVLLDEPLTRYRQHPVQAIGGKRKSLLDFALQKDLGAERYAADAGQYQEMLRRLERYGGPFTQPEVPALLAEKVDFMQARAQMRRRPAARLGLIWRQWRLGRYQKIARGWVTMLRDVVG